MPRTDRLKGATSCTPFTLQSMPGRKASLRAEVFAQRSIVTALEIADRLDVPFPATFEAAAAALARLDRMFFEPDGAFVWVAEGEPRWQVDGVLYDRDGRLLYVELKGRCPEDKFDLLACLRLADHSRSCSSRSARRSSWMKPSSAAGHPLRTMLAKSRLFGRSRL